MGRPAAKLPRITEKQFMAQVLRLAHLCHWRTYHTHDSRRSVAGFPDLVLLRGPRVVVAELKVGRNRPTPAQVEWLESWRAAGVPAYLWTPAEWGEIEAVLTESEATP
jgi:thiol:disulfide interchange protein